MSAKYVSIYDVMKNWCDLQQKCKDDNERFYDYYFDDETNTTYRLTNIYISNVGDHYDKEVKLSFNPSNSSKSPIERRVDLINTFFFKSTSDVLSILFYLICIPMI